MKHEKKKGASSSRRLGEDLLELFVRITLTKYAKWDGNFSHSVHVCFKKRGYIRNMRGVLFLFFAKRYTSSIVHIASNVSMYTDTFSYTGIVHIMHILHLRTMSLSRGLQSVYPAPHTEGTC
tara:strand:- start:1360 stop:1725 length:366 start_codon:yes stop_codon:yes gene_type:complete